MSIALCMIVRDEETALPAFLAAARGCYDELCVLDTGSADGTVALLEAAGARVEHATFDGDFAASRNRSLAMAEADWILVLDPDELPSPAFAASLRRATSDPGVGALLLSMRNLYDGGHHRDCALLRCFRNEPEIRYEHRIHEDAGRSVQQMLARTGRRLGSLHERVVHTGYERDRATHKATRDRELIQRALLHDPSDLYLRFKLLEQARYWDDRELWARAATDCAPLLTGALDGQSYGGELVALVAEGLGGGAARELDLLSRWTTAPSAALELRRGELSEQLGRLPEAAAAYERCLLLPDATAQRSGCRPRLGLARLALTAGEPSRARDLADEARTHSPRDKEALFASLALRDAPARRSLVAALIEAHEDSEELATTLLALGSPSLASQVLQAGLAERSDYGLGVLVCDLMTGEATDLTLDLTPDEADAALRLWLRRALAAGEPARQALLSASPAIAGLFPWLPDALAA